MKQSPPTCDSTGERASEKRARAGMTEQPERIFYLDWLRVLAVTGVFYAHTISIFNLLSWHVTDERVTALVVFGTEWGMALFFLLAGASAWFSLRVRSGRRFLRERFLRLVLPFGIGVGLFSPLQGYLLGVSGPSYQGSLPAYYPYFFTHIQWSLNPQFFAAYGFHLWFLAFLFLFSVPGLAPFLWLRGAAGRRFRTWLSKICARRGGCFLFLLPLVIIQLLLRAAFPGYQGWTDFFTWFLYFVYGYLLLSEARLQQALREQGWLALLVGIVSMGILLLAMYGPAPLALWSNTPGYSLTYELYQLLWTVAGWSWMLFVLFFGQRFLDRGNTTITRLNEIVLPFYVLHYVIVVTVAFFLFPWQVSAVLKFVVVSTLALGGTLAVCEFVVRYVPPLRWLLGMKSPATGARMHTEKE